MGDEGNAVLWLPGGPHPSLRFHNLGFCWVCACWVFAPGYVHHPCGQRSLGLPDTGTSSCLRVPPGSLPGQFMRLVEKGGTSAFSAGCPEPFLIQRAMLGRCWLGPGPLCSGTRQGRPCCAEGGSLPLGFAAFSRGVLGVRGKNEGAEEWRGSCVTQESSKATHFSLPENVPHGLRLNPVLGSLPLAHSQLHRA